MTSQKELEKARQDKSGIKCVVWDLDNTMWHGVLLEDSNVLLNEHAAEIVKTLDHLGILNSIASRNEHALAMAKLKEFGLHEYFLYPQINWNSKASSIKTIASSINIGLDSIAFIDDQPFEREEASHSFPELLCVAAADLGGLLDLPEMNPRFITEDSALRRQLYLSDISRNEAEAEFVGPQEEFLATLGMKFTISQATQEDLRRAEELTLRTNQLNTTGYTYSYDELDAFQQSPRHLLLMASLVDKYGTYGRIGLALIECEESHWTIRLLLMSCRVMSRGVGSIMMSHIMTLARHAGVRLRAEFLPNGRNRMMQITYKFANFREVERNGELIVFENDCSQVQEFPAYVEVQSSSFSLLPV